jgi:AbiV family abortive infection protein
MVVSGLTEVGILEKGVLLCLQNAKQYIKDADILFSFKSYRHSLALTILSDVELGKAVIYHLLSKDLIAQDTLPSHYQSYFREKQYGLLASETWWVGLLIASNVEYLVQNLLDISEEAGKAAENGGELSAFTQRMITELVEKMNGENSKLNELEEYMRKGLFADLNPHEAKFTAPATVEKTLVKERISRAKQCIKIGQPFLSLSLTEAPRTIAEQLLRIAFESVLPLKSTISQFTFPLNDHSEKVACGTVEQL